MNESNNIKFIIYGLNPDSINFAKCFEIFSEYGVIVFKSFFKYDSIYLKYKNDLI